MPLYRRLGLNRADWIQSSGSFGFRDLRERLRNIPSPFPPLRTRCVREVRQTHPPGARSQRSTRRIHPRWKRFHLQPAHRVRLHLANRGSRVDTRMYRFITTISAWTEPGCKNADNDPHASLGDSFKNALPGWCSTKKAGAIFFWLAFGAPLSHLLDVFFELIRLSCPRLLVGFVHLAYHRLARR